MRSSDTGCVLLMKQMISHSVHLFLSFLGPLPQFSLNIAAP